LPPEGEALCRAPWSDAGARGRGGAGNRVMPDCATEKRQKAGDVVCRRSVKGGQSPSVLTRSRRHRAAGMRCCLIIRVHCDLLMTDTSAARSAVDGPEGPPTREDTPPVTGGNPCCLSPLVNTPIAAHVCRHSIHHRTKGERK
jgi:hypothetical protein